MSSIALLSPGQYEMLTQSVEAKLDESDMQAAMCSERLSAPEVFDDVRQRL